MHEVKQETDPKSDQNWTYGKLKWSTKKKTERGKGSHLNKA